MSLFCTNRYRRYGAALVALGWLICSTPSHGQGIRLESVGARAGFYGDGAGSHFYQSEAFVDWDLPWRWDLGSSWNLQSRMEASAGWLGQSSVNAAIGTFGPSLTLGWERFPASLDGGVSLTLLSSWDFPSKDFGIPFQFTSHLGLHYDVSSHLRLTYRFQHMSNASLSHHNPGLNLHVLGVSYLF